MKTIYGILLLAVVVLAGCSSAVTPEKSARLEPRKTGLILATIDRSGAPEARNAIAVEFPIRRVDQPDSSFKNPNINSKQGVWLIEVPPGRYEIADWELQARYPRTELLRQGYQFEVRPGEVTYLGHIDVAVVAVLNEHGVRTASLVRPTLNDRCTSAVAAFREKYPALSDLAVNDVAPLQFALYPTMTALPDVGPTTMYTNYAPPQLIWAPKFLSPY